jgi:hypothetical protein
MYIWLVFYSLLSSLMHGTMNLKCTKRFECDPGATSSKVSFQKQIQHEQFGFIIHLYHTGKHHRMRLQTILTPATQMYFQPCGTRLRIINLLAPEFYI